VKVVFLGSGPFALPSLEALARGPSSARILRVVSRPERPRGRGRKPAPTPVGARAAELGLPCDAPPSASAPEYLEVLRSLEPDLFIVADYGEILRRALLELPRIGPFNLHASLLPRYRGAAPVARAILDGERTSGVTLFRIERKLDSGPIVDAARLEVDPLETAGELEARLARLAAEVLEKNLPALAAGTFQEVRQDEKLVTLAEKLKKADSLIRWDMEPEKLKDFVRALNPWPVATSFLRRGEGRPERTLFLRVKPAGSAAASDLPPGSVEEVRKGAFTVRCAGGAIEVMEIQREGKAPLDAGAYLRGSRLERGDVFGPPLA
jgi:methionyl-tRNA formyltransferase